MILVIRSYDMNRYVFRKTHKYTHTHIHTHIHIYEKYDKNFQFHFSLFNSENNVNTTICIHNLRKLTDLKTKRSFLKRRLHLSSFKMTQISSSLCTFFLLGIFFMYRKFKYESKGVPMNTYTCIWVYMGKYSQPNTLCVYICVCVCFFCDRK